MPSIVGCADAFPATVGFFASAAEREKLVENL